VPPPPGGHGLPTPPSGKPFSLKICVDKKCVDLGNKSGSNPGSFFDVLDLMSQIFQSGFLGGGSSFPFGPPGANPSKARKVKICINGKCMRLDQLMKGDPQELFKIFNMLQNALSGTLGLGGFRGTFPNPWGVPRGHGPGHRGFRGFHFGPPRSGFRGPKDPPGKVTYRSANAIRAAGPDAVGRVAELTGLSITAVRDYELVLQGKGRLLCVLSIPPHLKKQVRSLRTRTTALRARFHVTQPVTGDLVRGELLQVQ
jgi:hypothetical protein